MNTLAILVATDDLVITIDPRQLIRCIRYYRVNYILTNLNHTTTCMVHKTVPCILPQTVVSIKLLTHQLWFDTTHGRRMEIQSDYNMVQWLVQGVSFGLLPPLA